MKSCRFSFFKKKQTLLIHLSLPSASLQAAATRYRLERKFSVAWTSVFREPTGSGSVFECLKREKRRREQKLGKQCAEHDRRWNIHYRKSATCVLISSRTNNVLKWKKKQTTIYQPQTFRKSFSLSLSPDSLQLCQHSDMLLEITNTKCKSPSFSLSMTPIFSKLSLLSLMRSLTHIERRSIGFLRLLCAQRRDQKHQRFVDDLLQLESLVHYHEHRIQ